MNFKNMSTAKLLGLVFGGIVAFILVAILLLQAILPNKNSSSAARIATQRFETQQYDDAWLRELREGLATQKQEMQNLIAKVNAMEASIQAQNGAQFSQIGQDIRTLDNGIKDMQSRLAIIETDRYGSSVQIIRPNMRPGDRSSDGEAVRTSTANTTETAETIGSLSVIGTLGNRAWVNSNGKEVSISIGDHVTSGKNQYVVRSIDHQKGEVTVSNK